LPNPKKYSPFQSTPTNKKRSIPDLSVGARRESISLVYEKSPHFTLVPTFGLIPGFQSIPYFGNQAPYTLDYLIPNFKPFSLSHVEQYLEIEPSSPHPILTRGGTLLTDIRLVDIIDKRQNAILIFELLTRHPKTKDLIFYNGISIFVRGGAATTAAATSSSSAVATTAPTQAIDLECTNHIPNKEPETGLNHNRKHLPRSGRIIPP
jgi:multifunctional beta-oxidation protein